MNSGGAGTAGFVLTGGRSARMGEDKALLPLGSGTLVEHIAAQVRACAGSAVLVGTPTRYAHLGLHAIGDLYPYSGPLGGIVTALRHSRSEWNLIVACDMPGIRENLLQQLLQYAREHPGVCVVPRTGDGREHPICAVYPTATLGVLEQALLRGERKLTHAVRLLPVEWFEVGNMSELANVNTPSDWQLYRERSQ